MGRIPNEALNEQDMVYEIRSDSMCGWQEPPPTWSNLSEPRDAATIKTDPFEKPASYYSTIFRAMDKASFRKKIVVIGFFNKFTKEITNADDEILDSPSFTCIREAHINGKTQSLIWSAACLRYSGQVEHLNEEILVSLLASSTKISHLFISLTTLLKGSWVPVFKCMATLPKLEYLAVGLLQEVETNPSNQNAMLLDRRPLVGRVVSPDIKDFLAWIVDNCQMSEEFWTPLLQSNAIVRSVLLPISFHVDTWGQMLLPPRDTTV